MVGQTTGSKFGEDPYKIGVSISCCLDLCIALFLDQASVPDMYNDMTGSSHGPPIQVRKELSNTTLKKRLVDKSCILIDYWHRGKSLERTQQEKIRAMTT